MKLPRMARHENNTGQLKMRYLRKIRIAIFITMEFRTRALVLSSKFIDSHAHMDTQPVQIDVRPVNYLSPVNEA